jgi:hypothetical protein
MKWHSIAQRDGSGTVAGRLVSGVILLAVALGAACARGAASPDDGYEGDAAAGEEEAEATSDGPAGSAATEPSGAACSEDPCKLTLPQCGCPAGEQCTAEAAGLTCVPAGTAHAGDACSNALACGPGHACVAVGGGPSLCRRFCDSDADCGGAGARCVFGVGDGKGGALPGVHVCSDACDLVSSTGCSAPGTKCGVAATASQPTLPFTLCEAAGGKAYGQSCTATSECGPGLACFATAQLGSRCTSWCNAASPSCAGTLGQCVGIQPPIQIGSTLYGTCL